MKSSIRSALWNRCAGSFKLSPLGEKAATAPYPGLDELCGERVEVEEVLAGPEVNAAVADVVRLWALKSECLPDMSRSMRSCEMRPRRVSFGGPFGGEAPIIN